MPIPSPQPTPASPSSLSPGEVVADRYRIVRPLGEGGMGAVYLAEHVHMRKTVALKVLHAQVLENVEVVARFEREAVAAGNIGHPNVAAATDFGRLASGAFFLVLEYIDGRTLRDVLARGPLEPARALRVLRGVVSGLRAAHAKGVVHRDLKPENVMLVDRDGDPDFVKILDFGIAKVVLFQPPAGESGVQPLTRMGALMGTPDYMSPEQALGQAVDARTDLYTAGVILFEMLTGACPFQGGALTVLRDRLLHEAPTLPPALGAAIDPRLAALLQRLLMTSADARFQSADLVLAALDELLAPPAPPPEPSPAARRRLPMIPLIACAAVVALAGAVVEIVTLARALSARGHVEPAASSIVPARTNDARRDPESAAPPPSLPPPPSASASSAPAGRGGGRGGVHIPPPRTWFH